MKVMSASAVSFTAGGAKNVVKGIVGHIKENPGVYAVGATGAYVAGKLIKDSQTDKVEIGHYVQTGVEPDTLGAEIGRPLGYLPKMELSNEPTLLEKLQGKLKETFAFNEKNPPSWVDPTEPYFVDSKGNYMTDDWGVIVNPWYNPDLAKTSANAVSEAVNNVEVPEVMIPMRDADGHMVFSYDGFPIPNFSGAKELGEAVTADPDLLDQMPDMTERVLNFLKETMDSLF